jgi:beta-lactamase class A
MWMSIPALAGGISGRFVDDDGVPGERYLERLAEIGAIHGCNPPDNTRSCPDGNLTRAEAFKILSLAGQAYGALPSLPAVMADHFVDDDTIWDGAVSRFANHLALEGIIHGCNPPENTWVCPSDTLARAAIAKMVVKTFGLKAPSTYVSPWTDTNGHWYADAARIAAYHRLFDTSVGSFRGGDAVTRAEFAQVVVEAAGEVLCDDDPFIASRVMDLESRYPGQDFTAYAYDTRSRCAYWMNPDIRLRTASVFKVMVMAGTLLEAQEVGRDLTSWERSRLTPMITESANQPVRDLWSHFGGAPWFRDQARIFGLDETTTVGDHESVWGRTTTSAKDQASLIRQVLLGDWGPLEESYRAEAWDLMTSVVASQTWGVTEGVPSNWTVAQKNGFAGHIANSVGFVQAPGSTEGYVVVVLSNWWSDWHQGVPLVDEVAGWVSSELAR